MIDMLRRALRSLSGSDLGSEGAAAAAVRLVLLPRRQRQLC